MNEIQSLLIELLEDIDRICTKEKIKYSLFGETALAAVKSGDLYEDACCLNIAMTPDNVKKFIKAAKKEKRADRVVDYMGSNRNYPNFTVSYGAKNSSLIKLPYNGAGAKPCVAVTINIIMFKPKLPIALFNYSKKFWDIAVTPSGTVREIVKRVINVGCHVIKFILGGRLLGKILFGLWCMLFKNKNGKKFAVENGKFTYSLSILSGYSKALINGKVYPIFENNDLYFTEAYGDEYMSLTPDYLKRGERYIISASLPYEEYLNGLKKELKGSCLGLKKLKYDFLQAKVAIYNRKIGKYYAVVDRTQKRFAMWELYMPQKENLLALEKEGKYDELNEIFQPYRSALWSCYKKGLGLCFDKEIFEIMEKVLIKTGEASYAKKLRALVPEEHWCTLEVVNYKGEQI